MSNNFIVNPSSLESSLKKLSSSVTEGISKGKRSLIGLDMVLSENGISKLMLSTDTLSLVISSDCFASGSRLTLSRFFHLAGISFVGVGMRFMTDALADLHGIRCRNAMDLGSLAAAKRGDKCLEFCGLLDLANELLLDADFREILSLESKNLEASTVAARAAFLIGNFLLDGGFHFNYFYGFSR